jgi:8-oxo-dGTP pyrophosphatase MutT (NUDIX family)
MLGRSGAPAAAPAPPVDRATPPGLDHPYVTTYYGDGPFVAHLAEAVSVTIVGTTNDGLADQLETALAARRRRQGEGAFWESLHVVFLGDDVLPFVHDELTAESADPAHARRERARRAGFAKRTVMSLLLREGPRSRWKLYSHAHVPPFLGALLAMPDGSLVVQIRAPQPASAEGEALWLELDDRRDRYFSTAFAAVLRASREENEVVLVGEPTRDGFRCTTARFRRGVMIPGQYPDDWLPAVIAVTWRPGRDGAQPLLQLNTPRTSTREIGKVSHPSGYVNQQDHAPGDGPVPTTFDLPPATAEAAVRRELLAEFGLGPDDHVLAAHGTVDFYYHDKENLSFHLFSAELDRRQRFSSAMQMHAWDVDDLLAIRHHQVIGKALAVVGAPDLTSRQRAVAGEIVAHNLVLHGDDALADRIVAALAADGDPGELGPALRDRAAAREVTRHVAGSAVVVDGIAGLQFRAFFSHLLPIYAGVGSARAAQVLDEIEGRAPARHARAALAGLYDDEDVMTALPLDL